VVDGKLQVKRMEAIIEENHVEENQDKLLSEERELAKLQRRRKQK
jgi:hypothetical protein